MEEPPRKRGRPPGAKNKKPPKLPRKSARVEARKREAKAAKPKRPARPPVHEAQAEIVLPGEEFGSRPAREEPEDDKEAAAQAQMAFVWPRRRGRPEGSGVLLKCDDATLDRIWSVGTHQGTQHDLAIRLGVSLKTVQRFFDDHPLAKETFADASAAGIGSLRAHFYREAMSGNTPVLLTAAKHLLGYNDKPKEDPDKAGAIPREMIEAAADEFKRLATDFVERRRAKAIPG